MHPKRNAHLYASWQPSDNPLENIASLLHILNEEQAHPHPGFPEGFFFCRRWHKLAYSRPDNNVFIQALAAFSLKRATENLPDSSLKEEMLAVKERITRHYWRYQSFVGLDTYGFWQLRPKRDYFPYGTRLHRDEFFRPPDDADDTAVIYLTSNQTEEAQRWLHQVKLPLHANRPAKRVRNSFKDWHDSPAYTTFFADAMPSGFDVSVMANVLYWVFENGFELTEHDRATIALVEDCILSGKLATAPYRCSPYYPAISNIYYNLARIIGRFPRQFTTELPHVLWAMADALPPNAIRYPMEELLLVMGRQFLGQNFQGHSQENKTAGWLQAALNDGDFSFFALPLAQEYDLRLAKFLSPREYLHLKFRCLGFNASTLIEYFSLVYKHKQELKLG